MNETSTTFSFGQNWQTFVERRFTPERVAIARTHIAHFLGIESLAGCSFLDIGCGSGLSSLAAYELGADRIVSFDVDPHSVSATRQLWEISGKPANWTISQGSILDSSFVSGLEHADIVYSWGVLHHTGQMWQAVTNAAGLMSANGRFYVSLYVTTPKSAYWTAVKQRYNRASPTGKRLMELWHVVSRKWIRQLMRGRNPLQEMREYQQKRGMDYMTDIRDWLGGFPYEHARIEDVFAFARQQLSLELVNIATGEAAIEYLFAPRTSGRA